MQKPPSAPTPGDRAANFILPVADGVNRMFYADVTGRPIVLFVFEAIDKSGARAAFKSVAAAAAELRQIGADLFAVGGESVKTTAATARKLGATFTLFADAQRRIVSFYLAPGLPRPPATKSAPAAFRTFVLDANQRILLVLDEGAGGDHGARALEFLRHYRPPVGEPVALRSGAPVLLLPNVLEPEFRADLIDLWNASHEEGSVSSAYGNVREEQAKRSLDHVVRDPAMIERISSTLARRIAPELQKVFGFSQPFAFDGHVILSYGAERDDFFGLHRDNLGPLAQDRRFAMSLNLNDDFEGGGLRFPEYGPHTYYPPAGTAAVFSCSLLHEALPVTRGRRWVLTTFFRDLPRNAPGPAVPLPR